MSVDDLPPFKRGLLFIRLAREAEARRNSPRARAGRIGGLMTARLYPASTRPRDGRGRFTTSRKEEPAQPAIAGRRIRPRRPAQSRS